MPPVAAAAAAAAVSATTYTAAAGFAFSLTAFAQSFATSLVLGGLSKALSPKPKKQNFGQQVTQNTFAARQPIESRKHVYGHTRIADIYAHMVGQESNGKLHFMLILCDDEVEAIDEVWVNDYVIPPDWIDSDGNVTQGRYANYLRIRKHLGNANQTADSVAIAEIPEWTANHRLRGISYMYITLTKNQDVYPTGVPNFSAVVRGRKLLDPRDNAVKFTTNATLYAYDYLSRAPYGFLTAEINETNIASEANVCDEYVDTAAVAVDVDSIDTATNIITLDGDINLYQWGDRVEVSGSVIPSGLSAATPYYVIIYQTKDTPRIKLASSLANCMANIAIDITSSGTSVVVTKTGEPRYHGSGIIDTKATLEDNLWDILSAMAGRAAYTGGLWKLIAGKYTAPDIEFTLSDIIGKINTRTKTPLNERYNVIKGVYTSSINNYQPDDYPPLRLDSAIAQDNNVEYPRDYNLPMTNRSTTCQRIIKIEALKSRQEFVFAAPFNMKGFLAEIGQTIELTIDKYGWEQKEFEVTGFAFNCSNDGTLSTNLTLRETSSTVYDWTSSEDVAIDPAPNTNLPSPFDVVPPLGVAYSSRATETRDGDLIYTLVLQWDLHPDAFVREFGGFEIQFKKSSDVDFAPSFFVNGSLTASDVIASSVNIPYDLRIRARNNVGVRSGWVTILGAVAGSSGGVGTTSDWGNWTSSPSVSRDWGNWTDSVGTTNDWGYFT